MDKPIMTPAPGERLLRFAGDKARFTLRAQVDELLPGARALLRTNLNQAETLREEIITSYSGRHPLSVAFWRDIPMQKIADGEWAIDLPLTDIGFFRAKAYLADVRGHQSWPDGPDVGLSIHPDCYRTANTIYCAFPRLFGGSKSARTTRDLVLEKKMKELDQRGFTVIPPSGKLRDVTRELPHIFETLGCRVLHLLPLNPTPTTFARFGRFGSPYAGQDLTAIDPALVEFDKRTTGVDQFRELTYAAHLRGGRVILDVVINHTGWGSTLWETHPEWFLRDADGTFLSPGAWGTTWEDLVELNPNFTELWEHFAEAFLTWCRRGVDGFRCDAGYKVPLPVWQYIEARVRQEFPKTLFLLEGLGGSWEATETLLTEGGMQWAYSELFQNHTGQEVAWYLDYALRQSQRLGLYVHYSETHDNDRLAKKGRGWSLLRNQLSALTSVCGGFAFTCGVEWLADEKIEVHQSRGLNWGNARNLIPELAHLNQLLAEHPCFFDGATLTRLSAAESPVFALHRQSAEGTDNVLVLVNNDTERKQLFELAEAVYRDELGGLKADLLAQALPKITTANGKVSIELDPGAAHCLAKTGKPAGLSGDAYRRVRAQAAWALTAISRVLLPEYVGDYDWRELARCVDADPKRFLGAVSYLAPDAERQDLLSALDEHAARFPQVVAWTLLDQRRITPVPPNHWLLICDANPFRACLQFTDGTRTEHVESIPVRDGHVACCVPRNFDASSDAGLLLERYGLTSHHVRAPVRFLAGDGRAGQASCLPGERPGASDSVPAASPTGGGTPALLCRPPADSMVLLTNGIGGMARLCVDLGNIRSKYDCLLAANLHASVPVDRHILAKRARVWANIDGFIVPLNHTNLHSFDPGPPAAWCFDVNAGDGRTVQIELVADMIEGRNTTVLRFARKETRTGGPGATDKTAVRPSLVSLTVRVDIEDRNFHTETQRTPDSEAHFSEHCRAMERSTGFLFTPAPDRQLRVSSTAGFYHHEAEWSQSIPHPVEQSRGQVPAGDAWSPGWFELPLREGENVSLLASADPLDPPSEFIQEMIANRRAENKLALDRAAFGSGDAFGRRLTLAARAFVARRGSGKTVIAGYPWFLDWGRDSLICSRGLLAAGLAGNVVDLLLAYGRFVENGTMPNCIHGEDASNRNTSDAPLWFAVVCEEAAECTGGKLYELLVDQHRSIPDVLREIAVGYARGTPNGIRMDAASGLIWSPEHFTWMDTNHPAGTPREGYPVEIQVLWIRLLRQLERLGAKPDREPWSVLAERAGASLEKLFWLEEKGYFSDVLMAKSGPASAAVADDALRSNYLMAVSFGFAKGRRARRAVECAARHLVIPGALRTLAPLPVSVPLPIRSPQGDLLNHPHEPYWGRYEGDEDTRRKPAYHNGTAWTWTFPIFCEALVRAWEFSPESVAAAKAYLGSMDRLLLEGCLGQLPEILDGDAPHLQRGCDAQAWGATEALRVWKLLHLNGQKAGTDSPPECC